MDEAVGTLVLGSEVTHRGLVTTTMGRVFCRVLSSLWDGGWQPLEVARQVRRVRRGRHAEVIAGAIGAAASWERGAGATMPDGWASQLRVLGVERSTDAAEDWVGIWCQGTGLPLADAYKMVLETLGVLLTLPPIEQLITPPGEWGGLSMLTGLPPDDPVLTKIRALLAKAESTGFEAEAEALTEKAQELMARHAIDDALARADRPREERPVARRIAVDDPYAAPKSSLLKVVADANGVRCVWYERFAMMAVVGFSGDLDAVELLFTSLLVQASRAMLAKGSVSDGRGRSRTRSFRQSFLLAFAARIHERLTVAATSARRAAEGELGVSLLPVLASRDQEVDDAVTSVFPQLVRKAGPAVTNHAGWLAGRTAAELATLGPERGVLDGLTATG
jgi:hypothetical protein